MATGLLIIIISHGVPRYHLVATTNKRPYHIPDITIFHHHRITRKFQLIGQLSLLSF